MPVQHACISCGHDLSRVRAVPDPVEGLGVVVCPGCRTACVRGHDPLIRGFRAGWRTAKALILIGVQGFVFAATTAVSVALVVNAAQSARIDYARNPLHVLLLEPGLLHPDREGPFLAVLTGILLIAGLFAGAWTRSALAHLPAWRVWLAWSLIVAAIATLPGWLYIASGALPRPPQPLWGDASAARGMAERFTMASLFALFMLLGMPLGRSTRALWSAGRRARLAKLRRNRRRLRENR